MISRVILNNKKIGKKEVLTAIFIILLCLIAAFTLISKNTKNHSADTSVSVGDYPKRFGHYTSFFQDNDSGSIRLLWENAEFTITSDNNTLKQRAAVYPLNISDKSVTYKSSDTSIAEISKNGDITLKAPGKVTITATLNKNGYEKKSTLTVKRAADSIFLPVTNITMNTGDPYRQLLAEVYPENTTDKTILWSSKNPQIAVVDSNGTLKPMAKGFTEITATTSDGKHSAKCFVQVTDKVIKANAIEILNKSSAYLDEGQSITMVATVSPSNAKDKSVTWSSSDENIATISSTGKIRAISEGSTEIVAKTSSGIKDSVTLTVLKGSGENPLVLYNKQTSANEIPKDILGSTYINSTATINGTSANVTYVPCSMSFEEALNKQMSLSTPRLLWNSVSSNSVATRSQVAQYMNPQNYRTGAYKYQFLDISSPNGLSADDLNRYLADKGILKGMGQAFIDAANEYNLSEIYLVLHACLETGNGTSQLATGVNVNGKKVYNMFGIAAYDNSAVFSGSQKAYAEGWTTPAKAIKGGSKWISDNYVNNSKYRQNTLYDLIWNPENPGVHQYATDISWAIKQTEKMEKMFSQFPNAAQNFEVPVYAGDTAAKLE